VEAEHHLRRHADLDRQAGRRRDLLAGLQSGEEVGVTGRGHGVEVHAVGGDVDHLPTQPDDVLAAGLEGFLLRRPGLLDPALGQEVGRVRERPVGLVVEAEVGHEPVEQGQDGDVLQQLHVLLLEAGDELARLHRVVGVPDLHGVEGERRLEETHRRLAVEGRADAAREPRGADRVRRAVLRQDALMAARDAPDAARAGEHVDEVLDLAFLEDGDLALRRRRLRPFDDVAAQLVRRHLDARSIPHACDDRAHNGPASPPRRGRNPSDAVPIGQLGCHPPRWLHHRPDGDSVKDRRPCRACPTQGGPRRPPPPEARPWSCARAAPVRAADARSRSARGRGPSAGSTRRGWRR